MHIEALLSRSEIRRLLFATSRATASRCSNLEPKLIWLNCLISPYTTSHLRPFSQTLHGVFLAWSHLTARW